MKVDNFAGQPPVTDGVIRAGTDVLAFSYYDRSAQNVRGLASQFQLNMSRDGYRDCHIYADDSKGEYVSPGKFKSFCVKLDNDKEVFFHGLTVSEDVNSRFIVCRPEDEGKAVFGYLMNHFPFPLQPEWGTKIAEKMVECGYAVRLPVETKTDRRKPSYLINHPVLVGMECFSIRYSASQENIRRMVSSMIKNGEIKLEAPVTQPAIEAKNLDDYLGLFGQEISTSFQEKVGSRTGKLTAPLGNVALKTVRLTREQQQMVSGGINLLTGKKKHGSSRYLFVAEGMGCGKTIQSLSIVEGFFNEKWLRQNPGKTIEDAYSSADNINYRVIVMCPGHMVEKWCREIRSQIPYARVTPLFDMEKVVEIKARGRKPEGKEFYVISKDFAKLDYMERPVPTKMLRKKEVYSKRCLNCGENYRTPGKKCPKCGDEEFTLGHFEYVTSGLQCPKCGMVLIPYRTITPTSREVSASLDCRAFERANTSNSKCFYCDETLWEPYVKNIEIAPFYVDPEEVGRRKKESWVRITRKRFRDNPNSKTETVFANTVYQKEEIENAESVRDSNSGIRRFSPARYIKEHLRGYVDAFIADECHQFKGETGQGEAFASLVSVSKFTLALTGTLTGGKADDLYYPLWRLDPTRMKKEGFAYGENMPFTERYGVIKHITKEDDEDGDDYTKGVTTAARNRSTRTVIAPGISPRLYTDFLIDRMVSLDITDMSNSLPPLKETVVTVPFETEEEQNVKRRYESVISQMQDKAKSTKNFGILSLMLQFSLSYLDHPYTDTVKQSLTPSGDLICNIPQFDSFRDVEHLSSKEKKLVEILNEELSQGRNAFVYCEYTRSPDTNIAGRLRKIIRKHCDVKVAVLDANDTKPQEREAYIRRLASDGVRVIITNPKCVETGVDFIWKEAGKVYNYETIIFYQMGYSMFTVAQASRRHYRLTQIKECHTYYMAWEGTAQQAVIGIIASKQVAQMALQGKFSSEGLNAMAEGTDVRTELAKFLADKNMENSSDIQDMFNTIAGARKTEEESEDAFRMKTFDELIRSLPDSKVKTTEPEKGVVVEACWDDELSAETVAVPVVEAVFAETEDETDEDLESLLVSVDEFYEVFEEEFNESKKRKNRRR